MDVKENEGYGRLLTITLTSIVLCLFFLFQCWRIYISAWKNFPCIGLTIPFLGNLFSFPAREKVMAGMDDFVETFGDTFIVWIMHRPLVITQNLKIFEKVFGSSDFNKKAAGYEFLRDWLNDGLICSNGEKWQKRRKQLTGCFHFDVLKDYSSVMEEHSKKFLNKLRNLEGSCVNISDLTKPFSLAIICESAMGVELNTSSADEQKQMQEYIKSIEHVSMMSIAREQNPLYQVKFLFKSMDKGKKYYHGIDIINSFTRKVIEDKIASNCTGDKKSSNEKMNFLDTLLSLYQQNEIDIDGLVEEMNNFIFAGHDTVSTTLGWILFHLGIDKRVQEKVYREVIQVDRSEGTIHDKIQQMKYLDCVIKETMRIRPTVPMVSRQIEEDVVIDGYFFPRGTELAVYIAGVHRSEELWENPRNFMPERFDGDSVSRRPVYSFIPFSAGPRNCIGQKFALMELKISLFHILLNFSIESFTKEDEIVEVVDVVLTSLHGLKIQFVERKKNTVR